MNGREALKALADGKMVRRSHWLVGQYVALEGDDGRFEDHPTDDRIYCLQSVVEVDDWEVTTVPATDEELIAEMERRASEYDRGSMRAQLWARAANMLRTRKVTP